jgi:hypothetical protein
MDAAVIAVIGTLSGVVVTAVAGLLTATLTGRNQRVLAEIQAQREQRKSELVDRRADFATFLQAYDDVFGGGENLFDRAHEGETGLDPRKELFDEIRRFKQAHLMLTIITPVAVRTASDRCLGLGSIWDLLDAAVTGDTQQFEQAVNDTRKPRDDVRAAMRAQLGVTAE